MIHNLPLNRKPPVISYLHHAFILGIIMQDQKGEAWFMNNYIYLKWVDHINAFNFFYQKPSHWLMEVEIQKDILENVIRQSTVEFIVNCIKNNYYVKAYVDEYYLSGRPEYRKNHFSHDLMIYGFDDQKNLFRVIGFFNDNYMEREINMNEVVLMHSEFDFSVNEPVIQLFKPCSNVHYEFDLTAFYNSIKIYLSGEDPFFNDVYDRNLLVRSKEVFGINTYDALLEDTKIRNRKNEFLDIRYFSILYEHKKSLNSKIDYLIKTEHILHLEKIKDALHILEKEASTVRNLILKNNSLQAMGFIKEDVKLKIEQKIIRMKEMEFKILENLLLVLKT